jgi:hypothetical protein
LLDRHPNVGMVYSEMSGFNDTGFFEANHLRTYHKSGYRGSRFAYESIFERQVSLVASGALGEATEPWAQAVAARGAYFGRIFDQYLLRTIVFTNSMMIRKSVLGSVGLQDESFHFFEELEFALRICHDYEVCFLDLPTYLLRYHDDQISSTTSPGRGCYVAVRKQQSLLRAVRRHALRDVAYYQSHRAAIDAYLSRLHRAVAVAMLSVDARTRNERRTYSRRARRYLSRCTAGDRWALLGLAFVPPIIRRIAFAAKRRARTYAGRVFLKLRPIFTPAPSRPTLNISKELGSGMLLRAGTNTSSDPNST